MIQQLAVSCAQTHTDPIHNYCLRYISKDDTMAFRPLVALATMAASLVSCAPLALNERQAPNGVPDYVLKYGTQ